MNARTLMKWVLPLLLLVNLAQAAPQPQGQPGTKDLPSVIFITLDGVRWREVFEGEDPYLGHYRQPIFRNLQERLMPAGIFFGDQNNFSTMEVSNPWNLSLPAYQSIMAGATQPCASDHCGRIMEETLMERTMRELMIPRNQVATIASWKPVASAVERMEGITFTNTGLTPLRDFKNDPETDEINRAQIADRPEWPDARFDKYTWAHAMRYMMVHRPRLLYISLKDSDEWAHQGRYDKYVETLKTYDQWIYDLFGTLDRMGFYGRNVTVIVTTSHGRGETHAWNYHDQFYPSAKYAWLFARSPYTQWNAQPQRGTYTHVDIRPTIEASLGLRPISCERCGKVITEIVPSN